ncbi:NADH dehydrogenase [ubiquinone] 1 alpha subcomplex assembly factor 8 isoform X2 [Lissotriton helveticus]
MKKEKAVKKEDGQLMQLEEKGKGSVPWSVYDVYIQAAGGPFAFLVIMALFILNVGSTAFSNWWRSYWINEGSGAISYGKCVAATTTGKSELQKDACAKQFEALKNCFKKAGKNLSK